MKIIAICGKAGSGKDTIADYLSNECNYTRMSFASSLKDAVSVVFNWDINMLNGLTDESRKWREEVDSWWADRLNIPHLTPRWILQHWGTDDLCRAHFHDDIWIASLENKFRSFDADVVISDCRFPNEVAMIKQLNGKIINVTRNTEFKTSSHISENALLGIEYDHIIDNNSTLDELYVKIRNLLD
jgi:hypothetical protein